MAASISSTKSPHLELEDQVGDYDIHDVYVRGVSSKARLRPEDDSDQTTKPEDDFVPARSVHGLKVGLTSTLLWNAFN